MNFISIPSFIPYREEEILHVLNVHADSGAGGAEVAVHVPAVVGEPVPLERDGGVDLSGTHIRHSAVSVIGDLRERDVVHHLTTCSIGKAVNHNYSILSQ